MGRIIIILMFSVKFFSPHRPNTTQKAFVIGAIHQEELGDYSSMIIFLVLLYLPAFIL